jgi:acetolactate synthase-1/2/3 large subunit
MVRFLERIGVEYAFGIPGAHILPVYDALYDSEIRTILTKHEQGASFMAGGYARRSGRVGVCIATAGPGAMNLVTGLANAYMDGLPVLALTGETPTYSFGKGALQESSGEGTCIDQADVFRGVTRYNVTVQRADYLVNVLRRITGILFSKRPGPVLVSLPYNVLKEDIDADLLEGINVGGNATAVAADAVSRERVLSMLALADHPVVLAGHGSVLSEEADAVGRFSARMNIPVATTLKARGIVDESSHLSLGVLGITSHELSFRYITEKSDLLIVAGASFGERTSCNWNGSLLKGKKVIQVDTDAAQLNKVFSADLALNCDAGTLFSQLMERLDAAPLDPKDGADLDAYRSRYGIHAPQNGESLLVSYFLRRLTDAVGEKVSIFDDNIIYMQRFCSIAKKSAYFPNSGISSLGHAVPAAIGARLAAVAPSVAILGDGGFQMCCMELMTAVHYAIPVTVVLLNNGSLGLVRKNQLFNYNGRFIASDFINPDYAKLAASFTINHFRVASEADADSVLKVVDFKGGVNLIEVILGKNEFPHYSSGR